MIVAFVGTWLFSITDSSLAGQQERERFRAQFVRSANRVGHLSG